MFRNNAYAILQTSARLARISYYCLRKPMFTLGEHTDSGIWVFRAGFSEKKEWKNRQKSLKAWHERPHCSHQPGAESCLCFPWSRFCRPRQVSGPVAHAFGFLPEPGRPGSSPCSPCGEPRAPWRATEKGQAGWEQNRNKKVQPAERCSYCSGMVPAPPSVISVTVPSFALHRDGILSSDLYETDGYYDSHFEDK